ncbi:MAG: hypothetical protein EAZ37_10580 [Burkholderiales bacterium]|nr:MAG: hypothetical protein EAZ37_10580 [Burkholderiales bacterium]
MTSKTTLSHTVDPVLQELWQVKDAIAERFGSLDAYVAHLREQAATASKSLKSNSAASMSTRSKRFAKAA